MESRHSTLSSPAGAGIDENSTSDPAYVPEWFAAAVATEPVVDEIVVAGVPMRYRAWADVSTGDVPAHDAAEPVAGKAPVILLHGGGAHARWWDHIAPLLTHGRRVVVAADLTGHGDSGRREQYSLDLWADEVIALAGERCAAPPIVIGHSMGGFVALQAASRAGNGLAGVITVDSPVRTRLPEDEAAATHKAFGPLKLYRTREELLARFRPIPAQPMLPYIANYVADNSIRHIDGGWTWKFDPRIFNRTRLSLTSLGDIDIRLAMLRAERGMISAEMQAAIDQALSRPATVIEMPEAGHAIMLDQPLALVTALRTLLAVWDQPG
ncbi:MAG: alpha/beta hydrolase [Frankiales bacterium]|nr:alpha/beta hydrolase [Frankiales bacterium]